MNELTLCGYWAEKLAARHLEDLSFSERIELRDHVASCSVCAVTYAAYNEIEARIEALPSVKPLPSLIPQLLQTKQDQGDNGDASDHVAEGADLHSPPGNLLPVLEREEEIHTFPVIAKDERKEAAPSEPAMLLPPPLGKVSSSVRKSPSRSLSSSTSGIRSVEELLLPVIAMVALLVSLGDLFGLFQLLPANRIPELTLLLMSLVVSALVFIQRKSTEIYEQTQRLLSSMALEQRADEVLEQIDSGLRKVFKDDYFLDVITFLQSAIKERRVPINDTVRFRYYFMRTLQSYPKATFLSTSSSATPFLWEDYAIENATAEFIRNGGKIKRIFVVKNLRERPSLSIQAMIARQQEIGVEVHIVNDTTLPREPNKSFFVESRGKIGWEMLVEHGGVVSSTVTTDKRTNLSYCHTFEKLSDASECDLEGVLLGVDGHKGALIIYTKRHLRGSAINLSYGFDNVGLHTKAVANVTGRKIHDRLVYVGIFPALEAGNYTIYTESRELLAKVSIHAGQVAKVDWR